MSPSAILSVFPLDSFIVTQGGSPALRMEVDDKPDELTETHKEFIDVVKNVSGKNWKVGSISRQNFYEEAKKAVSKINYVDSEVHSFIKNMHVVYSLSNIIISRAGAIAISELSCVGKPTILVPSPNVSENHQFKNAKFYESKNLGFLIEEKDLTYKLFDLLKEIHNNNSILDTIQQKQKQYSDKYVYENINHVLKEITYEKN